VASRKEQKEALRRERLEREREAAEQARRKRMVGYGVGGALALAAVVAVVVVLVGGGGSSGSSSGKTFPTGGSVPAAKVTNLSKAAAAAGCKLSSEKSTSRNHEVDPNKKLHYRTNPPTDGKHYQEPEPDGIYNKAPPDSHLVHNLEHGRIIIWVKPSLSETDRKDIRALVDEDSYQMVLVPRANMPYQLATSAWGRDPAPLGTGFLMGCTKYGGQIFDAIRAFRDEHRSNGPEPIP
jgi:hypothetical protein